MAKKSNWGKVPSSRREQIFSYNRKLAADSEAAEDMREVAAAIGKLPPGQLKKIASPKLLAIFAKYGVGV